jgi:TRAP-type C4-dicarboxylate transport system permease small subunit
MTNGGPVTAAQLTALAMLSIIAIGLVVDAIIALKYGSSATVSRVIMDLSMQYPVIPLLVGMALGHFFLPQRVVQITHTDGPPSAVNVSEHK